MQRQQQQQQQQQQSLSRKRYRGRELSKEIVYGSISRALNEKELMSQMTKKEQKEYVAGASTKKVPTHEWTCYVRGTNFDDLSCLIKSVTFQLDPSFETLVGYTSKTVTAPQPFAISLRGYGQFIITITLAFQDEVQEPPLNLTHVIKLFDDEHPYVQPPEKYPDNMPPLISEYYDEIVIPNPTVRACELCSQKGRKMVFEGHPLMEHVRERDSRFSYTDEPEYNNYCSSITHSSKSLEALYKRYGEVLIEEADLKAKFIATKKELTELRRKMDSEEKEEEEAKEEEGKEKKENANDGEKKKEGGGEKHEHEHEHEHEKVGKSGDSDGAPDAKKVALNPLSLETVVDPFLTYEKDVTPKPVPSAAIPNSASVLSSHQLLDTQSVELGMSTSYNGGMNGINNFMQNSYQGIVPNSSTPFHLSSSISLSASSATSSSSFSPYVQNPSIVNGQLIPQQPVGIGQRNLKNSTIAATTPSYVKKVAYPHKDSAAATPVTPAATTTAVAAGQVNYAQIPIHQKKETILLSNINLNNVQIGNNSIDQQQPIISQQPQIISQQQVQPINSQQQPQIISQQQQQQQQQAQAQPPPPPPSLISPYPQQQQLTGMI